VGSDLFLDNEGHLLLHYHGHLHLNRLDFGLMDLHPLVLDPVSVGLDWHLLDDLIGHPLFNLDLHSFLLIDLNLNYFFNLNELNFFLSDDDWLLDYYFNGHLHVLNDDLRDRYLYDL
jgi:hypothetical protein